MYCNHCGTAFQPGQAFCASCGKPIPASPQAGRRDLAKHVQLAGILWIVYSVWRLIGAGALFAMGHWLIRPVLHFAGLEHFIPAIVSGVGVFLLAGALAGLVAGWGLLQRESWARPLALVLGAIALLDFPFGTALGAYTLWALLPDEAAEQYRLQRGPA